MTKTKAIIIFGGFIGGLFGALKGSSMAAKIPKFIGIVKNTLEEESNMDES